MADASARPKLVSDILARVDGGRADSAAPEGDKHRSGYLDILAADKCRYAFELVRLLWMRLDKPDLLYLQFETHTVTLQGRNLDKLYQRLMRREVTELRPVHPKHDIGDGTDWVVYFAGVMQKAGQHRIGDGEGQSLQMSEPEESSRAGTGSGEPSLYSEPTAGTDGPSTRERREQG